jgi:exopolyphosphatase/guanosine-5'-triphosphate,3'-diphosphate pyrophosphatase
MSRFAAIDVGSNALRLRVIEATAPSSPAKSRTPASASTPPVPPDPPWRDLATVRAPVRLGAEVFVSGRLAPTSIAQACDALRGFRDEMDRWKIDAYRAIATSAVREAKNGSTLIERARREAGIELEAIEGHEEARLIQLAVTRRVPLSDKRALLVDVGGGSTEVTLLNRGDTEFTMSLPLGTVRVLEAYLKGAKTVDRARERLLEEVIDRALGEALPQLGSVDVLVGTGGNLETLWEICPAKGTARAVDMAAVRTSGARPTSSGPTARTPSSPRRRSF